MKKLFDANLPAGVHDVNRLQISCSQVILLTLLFRHTDTNTRRSSHTVVIKMVSNNTISMKSNPGD